MLFLDSPVMAEPFKFGIREKYGCQVDLTKDLETATRLMSEEDYKLVIVEPMEFGVLERRSVVIPILEKARSRLLPILVSSSQTQDVIKARCGISPELYDYFHLKCGAQNLYEVIESNRRFDFSKLW